jgi:hypothetical protein
LATVSRAGELSLVLNSKFDQQLAAWLADDYPWWSRWARAAAGIFYNRVPRRFRLMPALYWLSRHALAALSPFVALYYGSIGQTTAYVAAAALFGINVIVGFLGLAAEPKRVTDDSQSEAMVRFGDLLSAFRSGSVPAARRGDAIRSCLGLLEIYARRITKAAKGEVSVSLVQYAGSSTMKMRILHRNPGNLRTVDGREFDAHTVLGHHACKAGTAYRVIHQLRHFGRMQSPTQSRVDYKSILFIPLEVTTSGGGTKMKGFVSIDCRRPYAFYGNRGREIAVTCRPIVDHLKDLLRENS